MSTFSIKAVLDALLNQPEQSIESIIEFYFSQDYRQCTNGQWDDLPAFIQHAYKLRELVQDAKIEILDELHQAERYADRHRVYVTTYDGRKIIQEVYLFATLDSSGRLKQVVETTLMLEGQEKDRNLGQVK